MGLYLVEKVHPFILFHLEYITIYQTDVVSGKEPKRKKLAKYDLHLKRFQYSEAFDHVLKVSLSCVIKNVYPNTNVNFYNLKLLF